MEEEQKSELKKIALFFTLFAVITAADVLLKTAFYSDFPFGLSSLLPIKNFGWILPFVLYFALYIFVSKEVYEEVLESIKEKNFLDENFLMAVASLGAFLLGILTGLTTGDPTGFAEGVAVILFFNIGEWFEDYAVARSEKSVSALIKLRPETANLKTGENEYKMVSPESVNVGDIILVKAGEKVPIDGIIVKGKTSLDVKSLTGESLPKEVSASDTVLSGSINLTSAVEIKTLETFENSAASKIITLVKDASLGKTKTESFIKKFAVVYTPIVVTLALLLFFVPPIVSLILGESANLGTWLYRSLSFLVVSCPCALVVSVPLSFFAGIGGASKCGVLIKSSAAVEGLSKANRFIFDKTGTLTKGNFKISKVFPEEKREEILSFAAAAEVKSNHPIALSIKNEYKKAVKEDFLITEFSGEGILAEGKDTVLCGNEKLLKRFKVDYPKITEIGTAVYVAKNKEFLGYIIISDEIKNSAYDFIENLNKEGVRTSLLSGDNKAVTESVANSLKIDEYRYSLLPDDKEKEVNIYQEKGETVCFIGDGINDAPSIAKANVGISFGKTGSDVAVETSDAVLMTDDLSAIKSAREISKKTMRIVYENVIFAISLKIIIMVLSGFGITGMWFSVFGDVGVLILAILNAMRANRYKKRKK